MRYRHPNGARLALTSGHVAIVGADWMELPTMFHAAALAARCEVDQSVIPAATDVVPEPSATAVVNTDEESVIRRALVTMIERDSTSDDFTNAGLPNLKVLRREAGIEVDKEMAYRIFNDLKSEAGVEKSE